MLSEKKKMLFNQQWAFLDGISWNYAKAILAVGGGDDEHWTQKEWEENHLEAEKLLQISNMRGEGWLFCLLERVKIEWTNDVSRAPCPTHHPSILDPSPVGCIQRIKLQVSWEKCRECREALFESAHSTLPLPLWQGGRGCIGGGSLGRPYFGFSVIRREEERGNATHVGAILR